MIPEDAVLAIHKFAHDESGFGDIASAWEALGVIDGYVIVNKPLCSTDPIYGTLFWQLLQLAWKQQFVSMNDDERCEVQRLQESVSSLMNKWRNLEPQASEL